MARTGWKPVRSAAWLARAGWLAVNREWFSF
jgi:hypothetical protein